MIRTASPQFSRAFTGHSVIIAGAVVSALLGACQAKGPGPLTGTPPGGDPQARRDQPCPVPTPTVEATRYSGPVEGEPQAYVTKDGDILRPWGGDGSPTAAAGFVPVDTSFGWSVAVAPDGSRAWATGETPKVVGVNFADGVTLPELGTGNVRASSMASFVGEDGEARVVLAGGPSHIARIFRIGTAGLTVERDITYKGYVSAVAVSPDGKTLFISSSTNGLVLSVDLASDARREFDVGYHPITIAISADGTRLATADWAGYSVSLVDLGTGAVRTIRTGGKNTAGVAFSRDGGTVFATNTDSGTLCAVDWASGQVRASATTAFSDDPAAAALYGYGPGDILSHPDEDTLFVTLWKANAIGVYGYDLKMKGLIPTGQYPTRLALAPPAVEGQPKRLVVVNAGGKGTLANLDNSPSSGRSMRAAIQWFELPTAAKLGELTVATKGYVGRPAKRFFDNLLPCNERRIIPTEPPAGRISPIEHVFLIIKENKTYDEVFGDLKDSEGRPWGKGDPALALFGERYTPNAHALARRFTVFDNFHCESEVSLQGHQWLTYGESNDYLNRIRFDQLPLPGFDPATRPGNPSIFDMLNARDISWRSYGQVVALGPDVLANEEGYFDNVDVKYPFWTQAIKDVDKVAEVIREIRNGVLRHFTYILLPNDHTFGVSPGQPDPPSMVADNDHAVGLFVQFISSQPDLWAKSAIFVVQDDPQTDAGDHIDSHRTPALVISPWVKRGHMSHVHYNISSVWKTIALLLDLPEWNQNTADAAAMRDIWTDTPDLSPYVAIDPGIGWNMTPKDHPLALEQKRMGLDLTQLDGPKGKEAQLVWRYMRPGTRIPEYAKRLIE